MNPPEENHIKTDRIPLAPVKKKSEFSLIWVIPIVALLVAASLVYKAVTEKGPTVTLTFKSAEGLEAGKTKIKYKDVEVGQIETIKVSEDLKGVIATVQMLKEAESYLTDKTRFWIVRARLAAGNVSGLGTLLSGSYVAIDPGREGKPQTNFTGMEIPPVIMSDQPGRKFNLQAPRLGSMERGSPVYFKGIKVGQVMGYEYMDEKNAVDIQVFIEAPFDKKVVSSTRFWFSGGLDVDLSADGLRIDTQSFLTIMIGGLVFSNPGHIAQGGPVTDEAVLPIYGSFDEAMEVQYTEKIHYLLQFSHSVRGLTIGAPVIFRGFPIGQVVDIRLDADWENSEIKIPVKIELEPDRILQLLKNKDRPEHSLEKLIEMGVRAQLQTGNILTGSLFVALDIFEGTPPASVVVHDDIIELPTIPSSLNELTGSLTALLNKVEKLPLDEIGDEARQALVNLNQSLASIRILTARLERDLPASLNSVSEKTVDTLTGIQKVTASDSAIMFELRQTLREFSKTAQSIRTLTDLLERHPESILQGKGKAK